ncbi:FbpB family small basic protein [Cytobacillus gottheilii]|uniref:FbpB family small basic protein n=1 Tax=Cytobacillus gottheilii TaxID=859144 RepID=A0ABX8FAI7_9BACI|nr:FbpB family small basic protein [Cytobacillus gottheilii]QVY61189.1 FbpB family small basic protein [Cytobacillus gottheilii]
MKKKIRFSLEELTKKNKEELLKNQVELDKIEKKIDERYSNSK